MPKSTINGETVSGRFVQESILAHLPKKEEFTLTELIKFLKEKTAIATQRGEISSIIMSIIEGHTDPTDDLRPILTEKNNELAFRLGCY